MTRSIYLIAGTYTPEGKGGINFFSFDAHTGSTRPVSISRCMNPSYIVFSPYEDFMYAISENGDNRLFINSFRLDKKRGSAVLVNSVATPDVSPTHLTISGNGRFLITSDYTGGMLSIFPVNGDGEIGRAVQMVKFTGSGPDPERQDHSYIHCTVFSPDNRFLFVIDLGADKIYRFDVAYPCRETLLDRESMVSIDMEPGSGPRHLVFHPDGYTAFLTNELNGTVSVLQYDPDNGSFNPVMTKRTDLESSHGSGAVILSPDSEFLYVTNREGNDGISVFRITDQKTLKCKSYKFTEYIPRDIAISPNSRFIASANQGSDSIEIFALDPRNGLIGDTVAKIRIGKPAFVTFIY